MRIAVVGSGIAGLAAAWLLARDHEVVLFEREARLGGHTHTHEVQVDGRRVAVDTGFIVFNPLHYPLLTRFFDEFGVASQPTTMGFSVQDARNGLEYNATDLPGLFCQTRNLASPRFWRLLADIRRFYRAAPRWLQQAPASLTLGEFLREERYSDAFRDDHLVPMASALWSSPAARILEFPLLHLLRFMANHEMLRMTGRPPWRVVQGGSSSYVRALAARWQVGVRLDVAVTSIRRDADGVRVLSQGESHHFDHAVLACHADEALALLGDDASASERSILGAMRFQHNDVVLHSDARLLPKRRRAWAAWNAYVPAGEHSECTVSYCMNLLQSIDTPTPLVVTLNRSADIDPATIHWRGSYAHPLQDVASMQAQTRRAEIQGVRRTWFAGAYWGFGFHEDGMRSGVDVARGLGVHWP